MYGKRMVSQLFMKDQHYDEDNSPPSSSSMDTTEKYSPSSSLSLISEPRYALEKLGAKEPLSTQDKTNIGSTNGCKRGKWNAVEVWTCQC